MLNQHGFFTCAIVSEQWNTMPVPRYIVLDCMQRMARGGEKACVQAAGRNLPYPISPLGRLARQHKNKSIRIKVSAYFPVSILAARGA